MFKKEAESKAIETCPSSLDMPTYVQGFVNGAEFGYNKANEWHDLEKNPNDLPKDFQLVLLYRKNPLGENIALTHWYKSYANDKVIAWKSVEPPKEIE